MRNASPPNILNGYAISKLGETHSFRHTSAPSKSSAM
jgi:hypothetical protein